MSLVGVILTVLLHLYTLVLIFRLITEMIAGFSREFRPASWFAVTAEAAFRLTDPPVKLLRKVIPPVRTGQVSLDVSVIVLFFILSILQLIVGLVLIDPQVLTGQTQNLTM